MAAPYLMLGAAAVVRSNYESEEKNQGVEIV